MSLRSFLPMKQVQGQSGVNEILSPKTPKLEQQQNQASKQKGKVYKSSEPGDWMVLEVQKGLTLVPSLPDNVLVS